MDINLKYFLLLLEELFLVIRDFARLVDISDGTDPFGEQQEIPPL